MTDPDTGQISISDQLKTVPHEPGVYRFLDQKDKILYIGKAKNLKKRVSSYFSAGKKHSFRLQTLVKKTVNIRYIVTNSEVDALLLENNLIKEYQPRYNINLKDGKTYPFICIKNERFPRVFPTRRKVLDGSKYYGPFASVKTMNDILDLIRQNFKVRTCNYNLSEENISAGKFKVCLEYQIGNCQGPCEGLLSEEIYNQNIQYIEKILKGNLSQFLNTLKEEMKAAAAEYNFELAEECRKRIEKITQYKKRNTIFSERLTNLEVLTIGSLEFISIVNHFKIVNGRIIQTHSWEFNTRKNQDTEEEILAAVVEHISRDDKEFGKEIISNRQIEELLPEGSFNITVPKAGEKHRIMALSYKNCKTLLNEKVLRQNLRKPPPTTILLEQIKEDLNLTTLPHRIDCFDNSNIQGNHPVASMVVFIDGKPAKKEYRKFKIKTVIGPDDFASMTEIIYRRYKRVMEEGQKLPDLIVVDGGKGQLSAAAESLKELGIISKVPIIGIAKKLEELYFLNDPIPLHLDKRSPALKIIQRLRNEAHRFAINFHRDLRSKASTRTGLTEIKGFGEKTAQLLLKRFKSIKKLKAASQEEIEKEIGPKKAALLIESIKKGKI